MRDIRDAHRKDALTADAQTPAMEAQQQLEAAMSYEGSEDEKKARVFLASLGIDYDALSQEEFVTVINVLKKSAQKSIQPEGESTISDPWQRKTEETVSNRNRFR